MKENEIKSMLTIFCKDNTKRIVQVIGNYNMNSAILLAKDLEHENYLSVEISGK